MSVELLDSMGSDLTVVNVARVSFSKKSEWIETPDGRRLSDNDARLIEFLARGITAKDYRKLIDDVAVLGCEALLGEPLDQRYNAMDKLEQLLVQWRAMDTHWSPFAHTSLQFRIKAPIFVARQLIKHQVGGVWNEVSRRYIDTDPEFYLPKVWRQKAANVKQGSSDTAANPPSLWAFNDEESPWLADLNSHHDECMAYYRHLLDQGVCPEQARMVLPQSMITEWIWTGSLMFFARVCNSRLNLHAQLETREIASLISEKAHGLFPVSWDALMAAYRENLDR